MAENAYVTPEIASLMGLLDTFLRHRAVAAKKDREYYHYHPSEWGECLRKQQYKHFVQLGYIKVEIVPEGGQQARLFDKGHNMHHRWQDWYFAEMGILRGRWKCQNPMCFAFDNSGKNCYDSLTAEQIAEMWSGKSRVHGLDDKLGSFRPEACVCGCKKFAYLELPVHSDEMNFHGHCDIVLDFSRFDPKRYDGVRKTFNIETFPKRPIVVDMKTINDWQFKNNLMKTGAYKKHIIQLTSYIHLLDCEYGVLIYENKNDSTAVPFKVERDDELFNTIKQQAQMMIALAEKRLLPPPRPEEKSDTQCSRCEFASLCHQSPIWKDPKLNEKRKFFYSRLA